MSSGTLLQSLTVRHKLLLLTLLTSVVALLLAATVYTVYQLQALRRDSERQLAALTSLIVEQSRLALRHGDIATLQATLETLARDNLIDAALVTTSDGRPLASFSRDGSDTPLPLTPGPATAAGSMVAFQSVVADGRHVGDVYLRGDKADVYSRLTRDGLIGGGVMLFSFLIALSLSTRVRRAIADPLEDLTAHARGGRSLSNIHRHEPDGTDELGVLAGALRDLGERLQHHESEQHRERTLRELMMETTDDALLVIDRDDRLHPVNDALQRMLGHAGDAVTARPWSRFVHPDDAAGARGWLLRARQGDGAEDTCELRLLDASARWLPVRARARRMDIGEHGDGALLVALSDRRESEQLRETLERTRTRLRGLMTMLGDAVLELDSDGHVRNASESAAKLLGCSQAALEGASFERFDINFDGQDLALRLESVPTGRPVVSRTLLRRDAGEVFPARVSWMALHESDDSMVLVTIQDLGASESAARDLEAAREAARDAARSRDELVRNISHEVRSPVTAIHAVAELLERDIGASGRERCLEIIHSSSGALLDVVDSLIDYSQLHAGTFAPDNISFEPRPVLEDILDVHAARASTKGVDLGLHVSRAVPQRLLGDPRRLRQMLLQLVGSAVRLTETGAVTVRATLGEERADARPRLRVAVRGHGPGMATELRVCVAPEPADVQDGAARGGLCWSLGLTMAQTLCAMMEGDIDVNELPGGHFEVVLTLPLDRAGAEEPVGDAPELGLRLLMLYASNDVAETLDATLGDLGLEVVRADGPREALHLLRSAQADGSPFTLALIDSALPGREARNLLQAVRGDARLAGTRLVLVQHLAEDADAQAAADTVLLSPVRPSRLAASLATPAPARTDQTSAGSTVVAPSHDLRPRVLVADDDIGVQAALCFMLEAMGYAADAVANGSEVLAALSRRDYDVVLLDCRMPIMNGFDTAAAIRGRRDVRVPVIAISGFISPDDELRLREIGVRTWLSKPVNEKLLHDAIQSCVSDKHLH